MSLAKPHPLFSNNTQKTPVWFMRQAGRYLPEYRALRQEVPDFIQFCLNTDITAEATLQPLRRFDLDAAIIFSDILMVPYALGQHVGFYEGEGPKLGTISHPEDFRKLSAALDIGLLEPVYKSLTAVRRDLPASKALFGFCGLPWTLAVYMCEGGSPEEAVKTRRWLYQYPEAMQRLRETLTTAVITHARMQLEAGADTLQLFDSWAGICPSALRDDWLVAPLKRIIAALKKDYPQVPIIAFPRGIGLGLQAIAGIPGLDGISLDTGTSITQAAAITPGAITLQGNLDPQLLVVGGEALRRGVAALLAERGTRPHIFNTGHGVVPETPPGHIAMVIEQIRAATP